MNRTISFRHEPRRDEPRRVVPCGSVRGLDPLPGVRTARTGRRVPRPRCRLGCRASTTPLGISRRPILAMARACLRGERTSRLGAGGRRFGRLPPFRPWAPGSGATPEDAYASAGVDPTLVRLVVLSHLHADHAGGVWADGAPRFPNARHVLHEADLDFFRSSPDPDEYAAIDELRSIDALGMLDAGPDDREVMPGMRVVHSPGHTPGHRSVIVGSGAESLLLTGDLLHLPVQAAHPTWLSSHDVDPEAAAASRSAILRLAEGSGWRIGVQHFARPFGRVDARGWTST